MSSTILPVRRVCPFIVVGLLLLLLLDNVDGFRRIPRRPTLLSSGDDTGARCVRAVKIAARPAAAEAEGTLTTTVVVVVPTMSPTIAPLMTTKSRPVPSPTAMPTTGIAADKSQLDWDLSDLKHRMESYEFDAVAMVVTVVWLRLCGHSPSKNAKKQKPAIDLLANILLVQSCLRLWKKNEPIGRWRLVRSIICASLCVPTTTAIAGTPRKWSWILLIILEQAMLLSVLLMALNGIWREGRRVREYLRSETHRHDTAKDLALCGAFFMLFVLNECNFFENWR